jgi:hypothetical protein
MLFSLSFLGRWIVMMCIHIHCSMLSNASPGCGHWLLTFLIHLLNDQYHSSSPLFLDFTSHAWLSISSPIATKFDFSHNSKCFSNFSSLHITLHSTVALFECFLMSSFSLVIQRSTTFLHDKVIQALLFMKPQSQVQLYLVKCTS